jgi:hypothetical protein
MSLATIAVPGRHRLEEDDSERFAARGRRAVDVGGLEQGVALVVADRDPRNSTPPSLRVTR